MKDQGFLARHGPVVAVLAALVLTACASKTQSPVSDRGSAQSPVVASKDVYIVKKGDTLHSIAADHGVDFRDLVVLNTIDNPNRILVGQSLRIRAPGAVSGAAPVPASGAGTAVVRPIDTTSAVEQRALSSVGDSLKRDPKGGKEAYSEQTLARAQAQVQQKALAPVAVAPARAKPEEAPADTPAENSEVSWMWPASGRVVGTFSEGGAKGIDISGKAGEPVLAASGGKVVYSGTGLRGYGKLVIVKHNNTFLTAYAHNQSVLVKEGQNVTKGQKIAEMGNTDADQVKLHFEVRRQGKPVDPLKYLPPR